MINETAELFPERNSQRTKVRYGPFEMDSMDQHEGMADYLSIGAQMPCHDCTITFMQASLEYPNGTYANANTSAWLHHTVLINLAGTDSVCGNKYYGRGQRWFASGNERLAVPFSLDGKVPSGYYIGPSDVMVMETELMNQAMYDQTVMVTITFEWIPGKQEDFFDVIPIWMDIGGCVYASDMPVKNPPLYSDENVFSWSSPTYTSQFSGAFLGMSGHLHDGGVNVEIYKDLTRQLCNVVALYGQDPAYIDAPGTSMTMPMSPMFNPMAHISNMSYCYALIDDPLISNGSLISITANYNFTEHMPMLTLDGDYDDIMGISIIYVAANMTTAQMMSYVGNNTAPLEPLPMMDGMGGIGMMPASGDDDDSSDSDSDSGSDSGSMDMMSSMSAAMTCVPMRDSPGTISMTNLNTTDDDTMSALLTAIMCDTCLQAWSLPYTTYFWYGIVVVIGLFGISRVAAWQSLVARKHQASQVRPDVYEAPAAVAFVSSRLARVVRTVSYRQITPTAVPSMFALPPVGIVLLILGYFGFVLGLQFTQASTGDLQTYQFLSVRAGWLSVAQLPLIVLLSTKRNFVTMLTAVTYERLNVMHRWTSRALLMTALMHFGFQWHGWSQAGVVQYEMSDTCIPTGAAAMALVLWMNLSTLAPFRKLSYEFFVLQHLITFFGTIIAIAYHIPSTAPYALTYVYITAALYLVTKLFQGAVLAFQARRRPRATLVSMSDKVTKVIVSPSPFKTWKAGSFARMTIPKLGLVQSHPATISSTPTSHSGELVFYLMSHKGFTRALTRAHKDHEYATILDGPYGGSQHDLAAFRTSVLIAGSTGVTYTLSLLHDIAQRAAHVRLPLRHLVFVWSLRDEELVKGLRDDIAASVEALLIAGIDAQVHIHITGTQAVRSLFDSRATSEKSVNHHVSDTGIHRADSQESDVREKQPIRDAVRSLSETSSERATRKDGSKCISMASGRIDLSAVLANASATCEGEMGVAVCGPLGMTKQVRNKVAGMQFGSQGRKAGTYLHVEGFSW